MRLKKLFAVLAISMMAFTSGFPVLAQSGNLGITAEVERRIRDRKEKVVVRMADGTAIKGRLATASDETFTLVQDKTTATKSLEYKNVNSLRGRGLGKGAKIGIIVGAAAGGTLLVLHVAVQHAIRNN